MKAAGSFPGMNMTSWWAPDGGQGLDFEDVDAGGRAGIDSPLFAQGFRAHETVFSLVTQVGRSGRAKTPALPSSRPPGQPVLNLPPHRLRCVLRAGSPTELGLYPPFMGSALWFCRAKESEAWPARLRSAGPTGGQQPDLPAVLGPTPAALKKINDSTAINSPVPQRPPFPDLIRTDLEQESCPARLPLWSICTRTGISDTTQQILEVPLWSAISQKRANLS